MAPIGRTVKARGNKNAIEVYVFSILGVLTGAIVKRASEVDAGSKKVFLGISV